MKLYAKWGAKRDGMLAAAEVKVIADGGAYMYTSNKVLGNTTLTCTGPYEIPHVAVDTYAVYTNHVPGAAFRGFGGPQGHFAAEGQMDRLAEALGMDPVELRLKNILTEDKLLTVGTPIPGGVGLTAVRDRCRSGGRLANRTRPGHWRRPGQAPDPRQPTCWRPRTSSAASVSRPASRTSASPSATRRTATRASSCVGAGEIAEATVYFAGADCGQGNHTIISQAAAEVLGVPLARMRVVASDTAQMGNSGSASASRLTYMSANAVKGAAEKALAAWQNEDRPAVGENVYLAPKTTPLDHDTGYGKPNFAYGYTAQAVQVAVDTETGQVRVEKFICADDVGKAINPQQVVGTDRGRGRPGARLHAAGGLEDPGRPRAHRPAQHLPDPHRARRARPARVDHRRGARPERPVGRAAAWARCPTCPWRPPWLPRSTMPPACASTSSR